MQQEIKLTNESSNTVFVDDVDVSKGVYAIRPGKSTCYVFNYKKAYYIVSSSAQNSFFQKQVFSSLKSLIIDKVDYQFYTVPDNKCIVTEREVTIADLKNTDHVGFVTDFEQKGHVVCVSGNDGLFTPVTSTAGSSFGSNSKNTFEKVSDAVMVENSCDRKTKQIYRFTTRKELYKWLAE